MFALVRSLEISGCLGGRSLVARYLLELLAERSPGSGELRPIQKRASPSWTHL